VKEAVFDPLGMDAAVLAKTPYPSATYAERWAVDGSRLPFYDFDHPGASAVYASANGLVKFGMFHAKTPDGNQRAILKDATLDEMHRPTTATGSNSGYGMGFRVDGAKEGLRQYGHTGGMGGVNTILRIIPEHQLVIVVLTNAANSFLPAVVNEVIKTVAPDARIVPNERVQRDPLPDSLAGTWTGLVQTWNARLPLTLQIRGQDVTARLGEQAAVLVAEARLEKGQLIGRFQGDLGTPDANRTRYSLHLVLKQRGSLLNGGITAISERTPKLGNALTSWVELRRGEAKRAPPSSRP
jgi:CubicO group peptidase (beta-lactamase class C family)